MILSEMQYSLHMDIMQSTLKMHVDFLPIMNFMVKEKKQFITARQDKLSKDSALRSLYEAFETLYGKMPEGIESGYLAKNWMNVECVRERGASKLPLVKHYEVQYFVEDRRKTCLELSRNGIICFMPRRPWNTLPEDVENIIQYDDTSEIVKYLRERHS